MLRADPHPFVSLNRTVLKKAAILISPTVIGRPFHTFFGAEQRMARGIVFNFPQPDLCEGRKLSVINIPLQFHVKQGNVHPIQISIKLSILLFQSAIFCFQLQSLLRLPGSPEERLL